MSNSSCQTKENTYLARQGRTLDSRIEPKPTMFASSVQSVVPYNATVPRVCTLVLTSARMRQRVTAVIPCVCVCVCV